MMDKTLSLLHPWHCLQQTQVTDTSWCLLLPRWNSSWKLETLPSHILYYFSLHIFFACILSRVVVVVVVVSGSTEKLFLAVLRDHTMTFFCMGNLCFSSLSYLSSPILFDSPVVHGSLRLKVNTLLFEFPTVNQEGQRNSSLTQMLTSSSLSFEGVQ